MTDENALALPDAEHQVQVVEMRRLAPEMSVAEIADLCGTTVEQAETTLSTPWAKKLLDEPVNWRERHITKLRVASVLALNVAVKTMARAQIELRKDKPSSMLVQAGLRASLTTLEGIGILQQHAVLHTDAQMAPQVLVDAMAKAEAIRAELKSRAESLLETKRLVGSGHVSPSPASDPSPA